MVCVIGDIHGCYNTLIHLIKKIKEKYPSVPLYSVGDLVDRGLFSCDVIDFIYKEGIKFTPGNHDYMFFHYVENPNSVMGNSWLYNGFEPTVESYHGRNNKIREHIEIIKSAPLYYNLDDCFISHAGISIKFKDRLPPKVLSDKQKLDDLIWSEIESDESILWTRNQLLNLGKLQVVGHTRKEEVQYLKTNNTVYIDTSAYTGNLLTAIVVNKNKIIDTISIETAEIDLAGMYR